jgi:predicted  nucleic acid-binding Zn-ribbon protein
MKQTESRRFSENLQQQQQQDQRQQKLSFSELEKSLHRIASLEEAIPQLQMRAEAQSQGLHTLQASVQRKHDAMADGHQLLEAQVADLRQQMGHLTSRAEGAPVVVGNTETQERLNQEVHRLRQEM